MITLMSKDDLIDLVNNRSFELMPSQTSVSYPIIQRISRKMEVGILFPSVQIAEGSVIVNGHHRYLASLLTNFELTFVECPLSLAKTVTQWKFVRIVDEDWDSEYGIIRHNETDARYNNMNIEQLLNLLRK